MNTLIDHSPPLPLPQEMRHWDAAAVSFGLPEFVLMENAARVAFDVLYRECGPLHNKSVLLFMGTGNNGGDAACLARHLYDAGARPLVIYVGSLGQRKGATRRHTHLARRGGVDFMPLSTAFRGRGPSSHSVSAPPAAPAASNASAVSTVLPICTLPAPWRTPDIVVDGLLGTGFEGPVREDLLTTIRCINALAPYSFILALDVPSGCNARTGDAEPEAVNAHATVCFAAAKPGLVLPAARQHTGRLYIRSIGIPRKVREEIPSSFRLLTGAGAAALLPPPPQAAHKNTFGHVFILGGSEGLTGAPHLAALAALRSGAGLVTLAAPAGLCPEIKAGMPEVMTLPLGRTDARTWSEKMETPLLTALKKATVLCIGPGMGGSPAAAALLRTVLALPHRPPAVLDADALNIMAQDSELLNYLRVDDLLTPHPGEAARLLAHMGHSSATVQQDRPHALRALAERVPCTVLLKGAGTLLMQGQGPIYVFPHDIPTLAIAGSGDVLAGCAAALLARGLDSLSCACLAVAAHGRAGHARLQQCSPRGGLASEIADLLPTALATLNHLPEVYCADYPPAQP